MTCLSLVSQPHRGSPGPVFHVLMNGPTAIPGVPMRNSGVIVAAASISVALHVIPRGQTLYYLSSVSRDSLPSSSFLLHLLSSGLTAQTIATAYR